MLKTNIKRAFGTLFAANRVKYKKTTEMEEKKNIQEEEIKQQPNDCVENDGIESMEDTVENTADNTQTDDAEDKAEGESAESSTGGSGDESSAGGANEESSSEDANNEGEPPPAPTFGLG